MSNSILLLLLLLSLNILHVEIKEIPYVLRLITTPRVRSARRGALCVVKILSTNRLLKSIKREDKEVFPKQERKEDQNLTRRLSQREKN